MTQGHNIPDKAIMKTIKNQRNNDIDVLKNEELQNIDSKLDVKLTRVVDQNREKGASSWLTVLPLKDQGFNLNKDEFRDALSLRYNRQVKNLPSKCACGETFDSNHAMNCKKGGFVSIRHDSVRNFEANLLNKVCHDVQIEPKLQSVNGDEARLDVKARGFWRPGQAAYFDVRFTNTNTPSQINMSVDKIYVKHENEKKCKYNKRVLDNEHGTFTPLVFSINGGMGPENIKYHKHLADRIATKTNQQYEKVITWIRCKLSFIIMKSALLCLRGSRSLNVVNANAVDDFAFACDEALL